MLGTIWFLLIGVLFAGYAIFDGFDLGAGTLYPFIAKSDSDKAVIRSTVGPVWDGNEVWLLTAGGALFAAFPAVYASVFSGFYLALMLVLFCLIIRAVALEFGHHGVEWRSVWDWLFFIGSAVPSLLFGVAAGNILRGVPLAPNGDFTGNFFTLLNPFALTCGIVGLCWFITHGATWIAQKATGELAERARKVRTIGALATLGAIVLAILVALLFDGELMRTGLANPMVWISALILVGALVLVFLGGKEHKKNDLRSFLASCGAGVGLVMLWASSIFPALVSSTGTGPSLTIENSASSNLTLTVMLIITLLGLPLVIFYITLIYRAFAGRVSPEEAIDY